MIKYIKIYMKTVNKYDPYIRNECTINNERIANIHGHRDKNY